MRCGVCDSKNFLEVQKSEKKFITRRERVSFLLGALDWWLALELGMTILNGFKQREKTKDKQKETHRHIDVTGSYM